MADEKQISLDGAMLSAQQKSRRFGADKRMHVLLIRNPDRHYRVCTDRQMAKLKADRSDAMWCAGYYNGAFTG